MGNLNALRLELLNERDHLLDVVQVLPVHDQVHGECNLELANFLSQRDLIGMSLGASRSIAPARLSSPES